jgi:tRNA(Ile)-lysidine synthase
MLVAEVQRFVEAHELLCPGAKVIVSVSGGADSMALLFLLHRLESTYHLTLIVAHVNHQLRGNEAIRDARFVERYADKLGLPFHKMDVDVKALKRRTGLSPQHAARQLRYGALQSLFRSLAATHIALGHTADDQAETLLMRLLRGGGPAGLAGIPAKRVPFIRPLLQVHRHSILEYLRATGIPWVEDSSNMSRNYLRSRIRLDLIPTLRAYHPNIAQRLHHVADMLRADNDVLEQRTEDLAKQVLSWRVGNTMLAIRRAPFAAAPLAMQRRLLRYAMDRLPNSGNAAGFRDIEALWRFAVNNDKVGRRLTLAGQLMAERHNDVVLLWQARALPPTSLSALLPVPGTLALHGLALSLTARALGLTQGWQDQVEPRRVFVDFDAAASPLSIRFPQPGDRFHPLGAAGSQKLQDFFVNNKVPKAMRPYVPLVLTRAEILWVVGYRIAEPFKVRPETRQVLELACSETTH